VWPLKHTGRVIGWLEGRPYALCGRDNERLEVIGAELGLSPKALLLVNGPRFPE
jgi:hypothetical protein